MEYVTKRRAWAAVGLATTGALFLSGTLSIPFGATVLGILMLVAGVLMLFDTIPGKTWIGAGLVAIGMVVLLPNVLGTWIATNLLMVLPILVGVGLLLWAIERIARSTPETA